MKKILFLLLFIHVSGFAQQVPKAAFIFEKNYIEALSPKLNSDAFSLEIWFNASQKPENEQLISFVAQDQTPCYLGFENGKLAFALPKSKEILQTSSKKNTVNTWQNAIITWNGESLILYMNGSNEAAIYNPKIDFDKLNSFVIGSNYQKNANFWKGKIGEIRIWKKALSVTQIRGMRWQSLTKGLENEVLGKENRQKISGIDWNDLALYLQPSEKINDFSADQLQIEANFEKKATEIPQIVPNINQKTEYIPSENFADEKIAPDGVAAFVPINPDYEHLVNRYEIAKGKFEPLLFGSVKPYNRKAVAALADSLIKKEGFSDLDYYNLKYLLNDNWEWADSTAYKAPFRTTFLKNFYKTPDFFSVKTKNFELHLNPVLNLQMASSDYKAQNTIIRDKLYYNNTRGVEIRGAIGKKIAFYSYLTDTQAQFAEYVNNWILDRRAVPSEGFWKPANEPSGIYKGKVVDFLTARGYLSFDVLKKIINLQIGYDRHAFGNGYRSLFLSNFSSNYLFAKFTTKIWKLQYTNLFTQLIADIPAGQNGVQVASNIAYPKKYATFHHLSMNILPNLNVGLFEAVVYGRADNVVNDRPELAYLMPIIFYRSIEQQLGSQDNALLGLDFKWNFWQRFQLYGQIILDEFVLSQVRSGNGWAGNKQAIQLGINYLNVAGIPNLDLQLETNIVRPYVYSHFGNTLMLSNYANYRQELAHPLGANFYEYLAILRYQISEKLNFTGKLFYVKTGQDTNGQNFGSNILKDYNQIPSEFENRIGQGTAVNLLFGDFTASYMLFHNLFFDVKGIWRNWNSANDTLDNRTIFVGFGIRLNFSQRLQEF